MSLHAKLLEIPIACTTEYGAMVALGRPQWRLHIQGAPVARVRVVKEVLHGVENVDTLGLALDGTILCEPQLVNTETLDFLHRISWHLEHGRAALL